MSPSDKKDYALVTQKMRPRLRRTVNTRHYSLPKPYRRKGLPEEPPRWKRKLAFYVVSGVVIGTLVSLIADLAESSRRERKLPIIAAHSGSESASAVRTAPATAAPYDAGAAVLPDVPAPYESLNEPAPAPVVDVRPVALAIDTLPTAFQPADVAPAAIAPVGVSPLPEPGRRPLPALAAAAMVPGKRVKPARHPGGETAPAPDPDVVLISAILTLAPKLLAEAATPESGCSDTVPHSPACVDVPGLVP